MNNINTITYFLHTKVLNVGIKGVHLKQNLI